MCQSDRSLHSAYRNRRSNALRTQVRHAAQHPDGRFAFRKSDSANCGSAHVAQSLRPPKWGHRATVLIGASREWGLAPRNAATIRISALLTKPIEQASHRQGTTAKRSAAKAVTYRVVIVCLDFLVIYFMTGKVKMALGFMIVSNLYTTVGYFLHERIWAHINWGR